MFHLNENWLDRGIRLVLGAALAVVTFTILTGAWQIVAAVVAAILVLTGIVGFCPLYTLLGINTRRAGKHTPHPAM